MIASAEDRRQAVHISMGAWALLLRWITWPQAAALATVALLFVWLVLPRIGGRALYRPGDHARGYPVGMLLYPFLVLLLVLVFRVRLDIVAMAWGILAAGDGFATVAGRRSRGRRVPWNAEKSVAGTVTFVVAGSLAAFALGWWTSLGQPAPMSLQAIAVGALIAAVAAGLAETIPVRLDDNITVAITAAFVTWCVAIAEVPPVRGQTGAIMTRLAVGLALNGAVAAAGWMAATVSASGVVAGVLIGTIIYACAGAGAWVLLLVGFAAAAITSRVGYKRKLQLGIAEEHSGRRGASNAIANTGVAAIAAVLAVATPHRAEALLALAAALVAGSSDTVASEIGKAFGRRTFLLIGLRPVAPGTSGALSLEGTAAGIAAAAALAAIAVRAGLVTQPMLIIVIAAATAASFLESALGATLEGPRILNNDLLNFINTAAAAALAVLLASRL